MTERINHAAEAVNFLGAVTYDTHGDDDRKVQLAQVHATLALVEQQRIANVLFIAQETHANLIAGLEAMGLDETDFEGPLRLNNFKGASK